MAKEALVFFLKFLPEGSIYNIVSFGTSFSMQFNDQNLEDSLNKVKDFEANLGLTNICHPLKNVFSYL